MIAPPLTAKLDNLKLPLRTSWCYQGRHTDVHLWPAAKNPSVLILFVCGNPGLIDYYTQFLSVLHDASPEEYEIIGLGQEGQSPYQPLSYLEALNLPKISGRRPLPTLEDQILRKIDFVDELRRKYGEGVKIVLIGHSVGAYICQEIMKARKDTVHAMYGLFPTLSHIATSPNGVKLSPIFRPAVITMIVTFLSILKTLISFPILHFLVRTATRQQMPASQVTTQFITSPATVACSLALAADEMRTIKDLDANFLYENGQRVTLYFAAGSSDGWVGSPERISEITAALDKVSPLGDMRKRWHICTKGMLHAFCLERSNDMADLCADWIAKDLLR